MRAAVTYHEQMPFFVQKWKIDANDLVIIDDNEFVIERTDETGHSFLPHGHRRNGPPAFFTHEDFYLAHNKGRVEIDPGHFAPHRRALREKHANVPLAQIKGVKALKAEYLTGMIELFEDLRANKRLANGRKIALSQIPLLEVLPGMHEAVKASGSPELHAAIEANRVRMPEPRTFINHVAVFNSLGRDPLALVPDHHGPGKTERPDIAESVAIWVEVFGEYASTRKPRPSVVLRSIKGAIAAANADRRGPKLVDPDRSVVKRMIDAMSSYHIVAGREGPEFARKLFQPSFGGIDVTRAGQRLEMDEWRTDLLTILEATHYFARCPRRDRRRLRRIRVWVTCIVDVATRCVLGLQFGLAPSAKMALRTLEMMTMDKTEYGNAIGCKTPWHMHCGALNHVTDHGKSFKSKLVRLALAAMGSTAPTPTAGHSEKRPFIESLFAGMKLFLGHLDGQTFANIWERADYEPTTNAVATIDFLNQYMVRAIVDAYHNAPHDNLIKESPFVRWTRLTDKYNAVPPPGRAQRRNIFGEKDTRDVSENGIQVLGVRYTSVELMNLFINRGGIARQNIRPSLKVDVSIDRFCMNTISYFHPVRKEWLPANNTCNLPEDVSAAELIETGRRLRATNAANRRHNDQIYWETYDALRKSGEAAAARAEIGDQRVDIEYIRAQERQLAHVFERGLTERRNIDLAPRNMPDDILAMAVYDRDGLPDYQEVDDGEWMDPDDMSRGDEETVKARPARGGKAAKTPRTAKGATPANAAGNSIPGPQIADPVSGGIGFENDEEDDND